MRVTQPVFQSVPLLAALSERHRDRLHAASDLWRVGPKEALVVQGQCLSEVIFLLKGQALLSRAGGPTREENPIDVMGPVAALELPAVLLQRPAEVGVRSVGSATLLTVPANDLRSVLAEDAGLARFLLGEALGEVRRLRAEINDIKLRTTAQRLASYLLERAAESNLVPARFVLPMEKRLLAGRLGCSQENLSRAFARLRPLGVTTQGLVVVVPDPSALCAFAGLEQTG